MKLHRKKKKKKKKENVEYCVAGHCTNQLEVPQLLHKQLVSTDLRKCLHGENVLLSQAV